MTGNIDLIYILSPSYSGSTLLTFLLSQHPMIATIGELKGTAMGDVEKYVCSCGTRIVECEFWERVRYSAKEQGVELDLAHYDTHFGSGNKYFGRLANMSIKSKRFESLRSKLLQLVPGYDEYVTHLVCRNASLMQIIMKEQDGKIFLDGSKDPRRLSYFLEAPGFNVKVIRLLRDGRGVSCSFAKNESLSYAQAIRSWQKASNQIDCLIDIVPSGESIVVRYEDLCTNTASTLRELTRFIGIDDISVNQEFSLTQNHINGNKMRLSGSAEIKLDERWREELSAADINVFSRKAGVRNQSYGYP